MSQTALSPSFRKRMLPLAMLTGLLVGVGLPTLYGQGLQNELDREALRLGEEISDRLQLEAERRPGLWVYDPRLSTASFCRWWKPILTCSSKCRAHGTKEPIQRVRNALSGLEQFLWQ